MRPLTFVNRWSIGGTLTTESELHIGDGGTSDLRERSPEQSEPVDVATVCTDHGGRAYVPGSCLKGTLRALVRSGGPLDAVWNHLLGSDSADDQKAVGGKLEFWDAFHREKAASGREVERNGPWWDEVRRTCVAASVSLDRRTRTAKENLLYHLEYVPAGQTFQFEITGDNLSDYDVACVLLLLERFNGTAIRRASLGASVSNGWGRVRCTVTDLRCLEASDVGKWKQDPRVGLAAPTPISLEKRARIDSLARDLRLPGTPDELQIRLDIQLESPWLIRDPRQRGRAESARSAADLDEANKPPDAVPLEDEGDNPFVPAKSLRGALRSRAEAILRTLGLECADHPTEMPPLSTKASSKEDVLTKIRGADLASRLFGLSGWRAPLQVPRLLTTVEPRRHRQEFLAIDRFTGGAAGVKKFDAELAGTTTVSGTLTIELDRLRKVDERLCSLGLLALVLRDLAESDVAIGSGSAKGQGRCSAAITIAGADDWRLDPTIEAAVTAFQTEARRIAS